MTSYLIKGINPQGQCELDEVANDSRLVVSAVDHVTTIMLKGWDKFTIEVEALDNEPDHAR